MSNNISNNISNNKFSNYILAQISQQGGSRSTVSNGNQLDLGDLDLDELDNINESENKFRIIDQRIIDQFMQQKLNRGISQPPAQNDELDQQIDELHQQIEELRRQIEILNTCKTTEYQILKKVLEYKISILQKQLAELKKTGTSVSG